MYVIPQIAIRYEKLLCKLFGTLNFNDFAKEIIQFRNLIFVSM